MALFSLLAFFTLYVLASVQESRNVAYRKMIDGQYVKRREEKEKFRSKYGADDSLISKALNEERSNTPLAEEIRKRLLAEANFDHEVNRQYFTRFCHPIALGILAQSGKIPNDFIEDGIAWDSDCFEQLPGGLFRSKEAAEIMERFIRWYDNELTTNGVPEHIFIRKEGVSEYDSLGGQNYINRITDIRNVPNLGLGKILFWPSTCCGPMSGTRLSRLKWRRHQNARFKT